MQWRFALLVQLLFSYLATVAFAIIINVPRKALNLAGWAGMMGWLAYWLLMEVGSGRMMANLVGAFVIGLCGIFFARYKKMPVIIFNIPGFVPLVPGAVAYQAVRATVLGDLDGALQYVSRVVMIAGAIAVGFMLAQLLSEVLYKRAVLKPKK